MSTRNAWQGILAGVMLLGATTALASRRPESSWRVYRSADYGFSIKYPSSMTRYSDRPVKASAPSMFPVCDWTAACFQYNGDAFRNTDIQSVGVSVNLLREQKTEAECNQIDTGTQPVKMTSINGTVFHYGDTGEAGMGSGRSVTEYRAFYQDVCFEVALVVAGANINEQEMKDLGWKHVNPRTMRRIVDDMDKMLHSFAFIGPVEDGSDWSVYSDWGCGAVFEYPTEAPVEKVLEYSVHAQQSERLTCEQSFMYMGRQYTIATKTDLSGTNALDEWLSASGYPELEKMRTAMEGERFTEYCDGTYTYIYSSHNVFIFTVSGENHQAISSKGDKVFSHLVRSFRLS